LQQLVKMGLLKRRIRRGREVYWLSFVERVEKLVKPGVQIHAAYYIAIAGHAPSLEQEDITRLAGICVHGNGHQDKPGGL